MYKPLLIGQAPGPNTNPDMPLYPMPRTSAGGRLCEMMGLRRGQYLATFDRMNLFREFPGQWNTKEDKWSTKEARIAAQAIQPLIHGRTVLLMGRRVCNAFGLCPKEQAVFYRPGTDEHWGYEFIAIPHPSGRNHWYNIQENRELAASFWREFLTVKNAGVAISPHLI